MHEKSRRPNLQGLNRVKRVPSGSFRSNLKVASGLGLRAWEGLVSLVPRVQGSTYGFRRYELLPLMVPLRVPLGSFKGSYKKS